MTRIDWDNMHLAAMYAETPSGVEIARRIGSTPGAVGYHLYKAGVTLTGDKLRYGCERDRQARKAELFVLSQLDGAIDHNAAQFQPKMDATYRGFRIEVKSSVLQHHTGQLLLSFMVEKQPHLADLFVCVGYFRNDDDVPLAVYVVPGHLAPRWCIKITLTGRSKYERFRVRFPSKLKARVDRELSRLQREAATCSESEQAHAV
jgi:hypothetical protein